MQEFFYEIMLPDLIFLLIIDSAGGDFKQSWRINKKNRNRQYQVLHIYDEPVILYH